MFVATKPVFYTNIFCHDKQFCRDSSFVAASIRLSGQKMCVCSDKTFVATKIILVAAPANDKKTTLKQQLNG